MSLSSLAADSNTEITQRNSKCRSPRCKILDAQRPLLRALRAELFGRIKALAAQVRQLRWLWRELLEKDADYDF